MRFAFWSSKEKNATNNYKEVILEVKGIEKIYTV